MQYHYFPIERMKISQEQSLEFQVIRCSLCHLLTKSILQESNVFSSLFFENGL